VELPGMLALPWEVSRSARGSYLSLPSQVSMPAGQGRKPELIVAPSVHPGMPSLQRNTAALPSRKVRGSWAGMGF